MSTKTDQNSVRNIDNGIMLLKIDKNNGFKMEIYCELEIIKANTQRLFRVGNSRTDM